MITVSGEVVGRHQVGGAVSAAVAFVHAHHLVLVATLTGCLEAFHVSHDLPSIRQAYFTPQACKEKFVLFAAGLLG